MKTQFQCKEVSPSDGNVGHCFECSRNVSASDVCEDYCVDCWVGFYVANANEFVDAIARDYFTGNAMKRVYDRVLAAYKNCAQEA